MSTDPFAAFDPTPEPEEAPVENGTDNDSSVSVWEETPVAEKTATRVSLTFKAGTGYEASWVVIETPDLATANEVSADAATLNSVFENVVNGSVHFQKLYAGKKQPTGGSAPAASQGGGSTSNPGGGRPPQKSAPNGEVKTCAHGEMTFRSGTKYRDDGSQYVWKGFFCPTPKGTPDQCKPQFTK